MTDPSEIPPQAMPSPTCRETLGSRKSICQVMCRRRPTLGRDEVLVKTMLQDLPSLLSSLESLSE